jgi:hypothetical protein
VSDNPRCIGHTAVFESVSRSSAGEVEWHLRQVQDDFVPSLSTYIHLGEYAFKLAKSATRFEAWMETRLVGLCATYVNIGARYLYISSISRLFDAPAGVATRLFTRAWDFAAERGCERIEFEVCSSNVRSKAFFQRATDKLGLAVSVKSVESRNGVEWEYWCASK